MQRLPRPDRKRRPALLPATLLLAFLALVGATVLWLTLAGPARDEPGAGDMPEIKIALGEASRAGSEPPAAPPAETRTEPETAPEAAAPETPPEQPAAPAPTAPDTIAVAPPAAPPVLRLPPAPAGPPLPPAPDPALVEQSPFGPLPKAGLDGREPWRVYARPFNAGDKRARIAIVIHGLGVSGAVTQAAIQGLPGPITLGFSPYGDGVDRWFRAARAAGHETLLLIPMEPADYPVSDPGPRALMTTLKPEENRDRLHWLLSRASGYVGVTAYMGSRFAASRRHVRTALEEIKTRGLLLLDAGHGEKSVLAEIARQGALPLVSSAMFVDDRLSPAEIDARLEELEGRAREQGRVVAMARPYPVTIERIAAWAAKVQSRGFVLVPVSALAERALPR